MAHEMSIEVLDGAFSATLWEEAHGDGIVQAALLHGAVDWEWHRLRWGVMIELSFVDEQGVGAVPGRRGRGHGPRVGA